MNLTTRVMVEEMNLARLLLKPLPFQNLITIQENFPRSIYRCLTIIEKSLSALPKNNDVLEVIKKLNHRVFSARLNGYDDKQLHNFLDYLQRRIHLLDEKIHKNYFHNYL